MLDVNDIDVYYGNLHALWNVSLRIEKGELVALIGSNGAGKSTLLKTVSGLLKPKAGAISFDGNRLDRCPPYKIVSLGISLVPEGRGLFPAMTVLENLEMGAYLPQARQARSEAIDWIYGIFPIVKERRNQMTATLSGGQQQMVAIARGMMARPKVLLLDEISLGLAPIIVKELFKVIERINKMGVTILIVEQNVRLALEVASRGYVLENGRVVGHGEAKTLLGDPRLKEAYLG